MEKESGVELEMDTMKVEANNATPDDDDDFEIDVTPRSVHDMLLLDYGCEEGHFPLSASCVTFFKPRYVFPAVKLGLIWNTKLKKSTFLNELDFRKPLVVSISSKK